MAKLETLVIDPDHSARARLREATQAVPEFGHPAQFPSLDAALQQINGHPSKLIDVIFISYRIPKEEMGQFIKTAKGTPATQDAAFILLLRDQDKTGTSVATNLLIGADGFLFEPYSVDGMRETVTLSSSVKKERSQQREIAAVTVLLDELTKSVNTLAMAKATNTPTLRLISQIREKTNLLGSLSEDVKKSYFDLAIKVFESTPAPALKDRPYKGKSSRVQKKMASKVAEEIGQQETKGEQDKT